MTAPKQQLFNEISNAARSGYPFYVYSLADQDGVFYIGKGKGRRVFQHEALADSDTNVAKRARIRASGNNLDRQVIAYFIAQEDAYTFESSLILGSSGLTNRYLLEYVSPMEKTRNKAQDMLARIAPFEDWHPRKEYLDMFLKVMGFATPRELHDWIVADLKAEIENPTPTSIEFDSRGKPIRYGYNECHGSNVPMVSALEVI
jgi:hypothetical protein